MNEQADEPTLEDMDDEPVASKFARLNPLDVSATKNTPDKQQTE